MSENSKHYRIINTPILFLIFNRPETTTRVFNEIRKARPPQLFIAADGPRKDKKGEHEKCEACRDIIREIDWDCEVKTLFRDTNLGCGKAVSSAITWFFDHVEQGIILEDDCLPHQDFFEYCEDLLERYKENTEILLIGGASFLDDYKYLKESYYFSQYPSIWGWASWRRFWVQYDFNLKHYLESDFKKKLSERFNERKKKAYWLTIFQKMKKSEIDTWDFQVVFAMWKINGKCIHPSANLVQNIGFGPNGTHTTNANSIHANKTTKKLLPLNHSKEQVIDQEIDNYIFEKYYYVKPKLREIIFKFSRKMKIRWNN